jgi:Uma2 family endonuclease
LLTNQLAGKPCRVFSSDLRIRVTATGLATYPDVTVVCGKLEIDGDDPRHQTVTNPRAVVEILSPTTEEYDRGEKLAHYQKIESLEAVVLVAQDERRIDVWLRGEGGWRVETVAGTGASELASLGCRLALDDVYRDPLAAP